MASTRPGAFQKLRAWLWPKLAARVPAKCQLSYSQFGEDMVLSWLARGRKRPGFYVEIGAFHPVWLSNTYALYCKGWRGITVEARAGATADFALHRPGDTHLELCVCPQPGSSVEFFVFEDPGLCTVDPAQADEYLKMGHRLKTRHRVAAATLPEILEKHAPPNTPIDLLSIDIEGVDEPVLRANDWERFRPTILIVERGGVGFRELAGDSLVQFLEGLGYELVGLCGVSLIFRQTVIWRKDFFDEAA